MRALSTRTINSSATALELYGRNERPIGMKEISGPNLLGITRRSVTRGVFVPTETLTFTVTYPEDADNAYAGADATLNLAFDAEQTANNA